jgi:hypothetical protein
LTIVNNAGPARPPWRYTMRIAVLVLGLILAFGLFMQSLLLAAAESIDDALNARENEATGGSVGVLVALVYLVASALVIAKPRFSMWAFASGAVIAIIGSASTAFADLMVWGIVGVVLALLSWRGSIEKRAKDAEDRAGREAIQALAARGVSTDLD